jgi:predicted DNA-binding WGR domain protein
MSFIVYDMLIGNPSLIIEREKTKNFEWMNKVRVVYKDGKISNKTGYYNGGGKVIFKNGGLFSSEESESVADVYNDDIYDYKGYLILDETYKYLKKNKSFNCLKDQNLFDLMKKFYQKNKKNMFSEMGEQYIYIDAIDKNKIWQLENPNKNIKNKERIEKIINNFYLFSCKTNDKMITKYFEYKEKLSNKFWKISYKDGYCKITYGKIGSKGITIEKKEPLLKILKLIKSKEEKGYKLKK